MTRCPCSWSQAARWTARVDFPTPPFEFATAMIMYSDIEDIHHESKRYLWKEGSMSFRMAFLKVGVKDT